MKAIPISQKLARPTETKLPLTTSQTCAYMRKSPLSCLAEAYAPASLRDFASIEAVGRSSKLETEFNFKFYTSLIITECLHYSPIYSIYLPFFADISVFRKS